MEIFTKDLLIGDFRVSDFGLMIASFSYDGNSEDEIGMNIETIEEFIGYNPVPVYLGQKYTDKLKPQITLVKNPCTYKDNLAFNVYECRAILRKITGIRGYQWMKTIDNNFTDDVWYKARVVSISYRRVGENVVGIVLNMECNSSFAWSSENNITINATANKPFFIFNNTDDLNNYVLPTIKITSLSNGTLSLNNKTDNWISEIKNIKANETISMNSNKEILSSSTIHNLLLNDFNMHWGRLMPDKNEYLSNMDAVITFNFRVPRKVGFL